MTAAAVKAVWSLKGCISDSITILPKSGCALDDCTPLNTHSAFTCVVIYSLVNIPFEKSRPISLFDYNNADAGGWSMSITSASQVISDGATPAGKFEFYNVGALNMPSGFATYNAWPAVKETFMYGTYIVTFGMDNSGNAAYGITGAPITGIGLPATANTWFSAAAGFSLPGAYTGRGIIGGCEEMYLHEFYVTNTPYDITSQTGIAGMPSPIYKTHADFAVPFLASDGSTPFIVEDVNCKTHVTFGPSGQVNDTKGLPWYLYRIGTGIPLPTTDVWAIDWATAGSSGGSTPGTKHNSGKD